MLEQLRRRRPLIRLELPGLARCENSHQPRPVLRLEVSRAVDEDEFSWLGAAATAVRTDRGSVWIGGVRLDAERTLDLHEIGIGRHAERWVVGWDEDSFAEEGFDIRHADER